jgi:hypothetical protein
MEEDSLERQATALYLTQKAYHSAYQKKNRQSDDPDVEWWDDLPVFCLPEQLRNDRIPRFSIDDVPTSVVWV